MDYTLQRATLAREARLPAAPGVISRRMISVTIEPAVAGTGIVFHRADTGRRWPADLAHVESGVNCTVLTDDTDSVAFVEHLLAALWASGISDAVVTLDGPEVPLYDGSALPIRRAIVQAGCRELSALWEPLVVKRPLSYACGDRLITATPDARTTYEYHLDHPHPLIGRQSALFTTGDDFDALLAPARTFATAEQLETTRGGIEEGAEQVCLIVYADRLSAATPVSDNFARHKLVDMAGDLFLCGRPIIGHITAARSGHVHNHAFARMLLQQCG